MCYTPLRDRILQGCGQWIEYSLFECFLTKRVSLGTAPPTARWSNGVRGARIS